MPAAGAAAAMAALPPLREALDDLGSVGAHVDRLAALLQEAHATLGVLRGGDAGGPASDASGRLERELVAVMTEVLGDVEGELRGVGARLRDTAGGLGAALDALEEGLAADAALAGRAR